ncbi:macro domain-containing protein [Desulfurococcaceae archaeon MEX13E-LK6-19]|nr:macro domain-containing protein [Desulfurococcaceae archaeon MEX13E-LK6-19]
MKNIGGTEIIVVKGDITKMDVDAIVNPANSYMVMGGGVAYAIKKAGGQIIEDEARKHAPVPVGKAVATTAGRLSAKYVIHAPTMERPAMRIGTEQVRLAVKAALEKAKELNIESIAFPGMGTGVGGVPYKDAAKTMVNTVKEFLRNVKHSIRKVYLVGYTEELANAFCEALEEEQ